MSRFTAWRQSPKLGQPCGRYCSIAQKALPQILTVLPVLLDVSFSLRQLPDRVVDRPAVFEDVAHATVAVLGSWWLWLVFLWKPAMCHLQHALQHKPR